MVVLHIWTHKMYYVICYLSVNVNVNVNPIVNAIVNVTATVAVTSAWRVRRAEKVPGKLHGTPRIPLRDGKLHFNENALNMLHIAPKLLAHFVNVDFLS